MSRRQGRRVYYEHFDNMKQLVEFLNNLELELDDCKIVHAPRSGAGDISSDEAFYLIYLFEEEEEEIKENAPSAERNLQPEADDGDGATDENAETDVDDDGDDDDRDLDPDDLEEGGV